MRGLYKLSVLVSAFLFCEEHMGCDFMDTKDPHVNKYPFHSNLNSGVGYKSGMDEWAGHG